MERDADRTREAILGAAEMVFAKYGFDATTMRAIGEAAGLSRGTAAYFFGSKNDLYEAVLARVMERARLAMLDAYEHTAPDASVEDAVANYVGVLLEFLARDQAFFRLVQREGLADASRVAQLFGQPVDDALIAFAGPAKEAGLSPQRLLLDVLPVLVPVRPRAHSAARIGHEPSRPGVPRSTQEAHRGARGCAVAFELTSGLNCLIARKASLGRVFGHTALASKCRSRLVSPPVLMALVSVRSGVRSKVPGQTG